MKRFYLLSLLIILALPLFLRSQGSIYYLRIDRTTDISEGKYSLLIDMKQINNILSQTDLQNIKAYIEFADANDLVKARLGTIENGKVSWSQKIIDDQFLLVKFHRSYYKEIVEKLEENAISPGYQILLSDIKNQTVLEGFKITFCRLPDLGIDVTYPVKIAPGQLLNQEIAITIKNTGALEAKDFQVELILSGDKEIPSQKTAFSEHYSEDCLLKNGLINITSLNPGESRLLNFNDPISIPRDTPPGKYYLFALIDSGKKINEFDEKNNVFQGFILVDYKEPKKISLLMKNTVLEFEPLTYALRISSQGIPLSDGKDWRKCRMKAYLFQIKHIGWQNNHWEINTLGRAGVWEITGAEFCKTGGKEKELEIKIAVTGGSKIALPSKIKLFLPETTLEYQPGTRKLNALMFGNQIIYVPFWKVCKISSHIYQFRHEIWTGFFLEVNTQEKTAYKVTNGDFCKAGGTQEPLNINIQIEE
jgi:hypothetical protein